MQKKLTGAGHLLLTLALAAPALAVEPSPVQATGVINEKFGADSSNWDIAPFNAFTFTQTEKKFPISTTSAILRWSVSAAIRLQ